jgi:hypothetical protein
MLNAVSLSAFLCLSLCIHTSIPHTCWVRHVLTLAIINVVQKEEAAMEFAEDVFEF